MANAIELIKAEHRKVEQLYQRYQSGNGQTQQKRSIVQEMCHESDTPRRAGGLMSGAASKAVTC